MKKVFSTLVPTNKDIGPPFFLHSSRKCEKGNVFFLNVQPFGAVD